VAKSTQEEAQIQGLIEGAFRDDPLGRRLAVGTSRINDSQARYLRNPELKVISGQEGERCCQPVNLSAFIWRARLCPLCGGDPGAGCEFLYGYCPHPGFRYFGRGQHLGAGRVSAGGGPPAALHASRGSIIPFA